MFKPLLLGALIAASSFTAFTPSPALAIKSPHGAGVANRTVPRPPYKVRRAINHFWGSQYRQGQARRVSYCESTYRTTAVIDGRSLGIFQMGHVNVRFTHLATSTPQMLGCKQKQPISTSLLLGGRGCRGPVVPDVV